MTKVVTTTADAGRSCPYCRFPLKEGAAAERCDGCNSLHHEDCWQDGGGCAVLGCVRAGTATAPVAGTYAPPPSHLPGGYPLPPHELPRASSLTVLIVAGVVALLGVGIGVMVATGVLSGSTRASGQATSPTVTAHTTPTTTAAGLAPAEQGRDRQAILGILDTYQRAYSDHSISGLASIFTPEVKRHGLAAGGCIVSQGRGAVLADYQSQFNEGSGAYELVGLSEAEIQLDGRTRAHLDGHYQLTPGTSGYVNFRFAELGEGWKVSEVNATCQ